MTDLFWEGVGREKIYFDGKKLYFVRDPEGFGLWIFGALLATAFFVEGYERALPLLAAHVGWNLPEATKVIAGFVTSALILILAYIFLFYKPSKVPGDKRKNYLCYDIKKKVLESRKPDGNMEFVALGTHVLAEFPVAYQQAMMPKYGRSYTAYITFNGVRRPMASALNPSDLIALLERLKKLGMKTAIQE